MKTTATPMTPLNGFYFHFFGVKSSFSIFCLYIFFLRWVGRTAFANMVNEMMNTTTTDTNCRAIHQLLTINVKRRAIHWNRTIRTSQVCILCAIITKENAVRSSYATVLSQWNSLMRFSAVIKYECDDERNRIKWIWRPTTTSTVRIEWRGMTTVFHIYCLAHIRSS